MSRYHEGLHGESVPERWEVVNTAILFSPEDVQVLQEACTQDKAQIQRYAGRLANTSELMEQLGEYKAKDKNYALSVSEAIYKLENALKAQVEDDKGWLPTSTIHLDGVSSSMTSVQIDTDLGLFNTGPVGVEAFELEGQRAVFMGFGWKDKNTEITYAFIANINGAEQQTDIYLAPSADQDVLTERLISELHIAENPDSSDIR